ncbi:MULTISPECIES: efflux RND transporter periplasmic adaptor subunit [Nitrincola]|uniref:Macrolide-specific efflux protein macA n=1 Tax=Nitrincola nitratireducens TaxID=1229521 RepID=W9VFZ4_9GAMM|nr:MULTISPECIES: efflux RND transporter periplasmic adaptor subunit [Nitrincola]EXJ09605.1 Macrolide-specific efflux protein macA precursor [Nitrincola nitratireducens]
MVRKKRKSKAWLFIWVALLLGGALIGGYYWTQSQNGQAQQVTVSVTRGNIENVVTATGRLQPSNYVDVGAQVSGQLTHIHVEVGDFVEEGQLLAEIDPTVLSAGVDAIRAQLRNQRAQLEDREASLTLADLQYKRQQNLMTTRATSQESLQIAEATLRSARAQVSAIKAQIEQTESTLRAEEANLNYAKIYAPMSGTVVSISARQGQTLNANQQAPVILQIADLSVMTVQAQVSEADISRLRDDMPAYFTTLGNPLQRWYGHLRRIEPTPVVESNVVLYNALFDVENVQGRLMPQMTAQVFFVIASAENVLQLPISALQYRNEGARPESARQSSNSEGRPSQTRERQATVLRLNEQGGVDELEVKVGVTNRVNAQIMDGVLSEGDQVLLQINRSAARSNMNASAGPSMGPMNAAQPRMR